MVILSAMAATAIAMSSSKAGILATYNNGTSLGLFTDGGVKIRDYSTTLTDAKAVATDNSGNVYVGDGGSIKMYNIATGAFVRDIVAGAGYTSTEALAFNPAKPGEIISISPYSGSNGQMVRWDTSATNVADPGYITVGVGYTGAACYPDGALYATTGAAGVVEAFWSDTFGYLGVAKSGLGTAGGVASIPGTDLYYVSSSLNKVQTQITGLDIITGLDDPRGITGIGTGIFVANFGTDQILNYDTSGNLISEFSITDPIALAYTIFGSVIIQYGFDYTEATVSSENGGVVNNDTFFADSAHNHAADGAVAAGSGNGGTYVMDIPPASRRQFTTGIGSLNTSFGNAIRSSGLGFVSNGEVFEAGGLTVEAWIKNDGVNVWTEGMTIMSVGGVLDIKIHNGEISLQDGYDGHYIGAAIDGTSWTHVAGVLTANTSSGVTEMALFVNGVRQATSYYSQGAPFLNRFVGIGSGQGDAPYDPYNEYSGLIYEPRISLGALAPAQFTVVASAPVTVTLTNVVIVNSTDLQFTLSGTGSGSFVVEASQSLGEPDEWVPLQTLTGSLPMTFTDSNVVGTYPKRFYRVAITP